MTPTTLANQVKGQRIKKGWSQELLAENAGLSLRTIQRIEQGSTIPRGDTLNKLFSTLDIVKEDFTETTASSDNSFLANLNLSALSFLLFPLLGVILPFLIWVTNKEKLTNPKAGKDLINFQITWNILFFAIYIGFYQYTLYKINSSGEISISLINDQYTYLYMAVGFLYLYNLLFIFYNIYQLKSTAEVNYHPKINFIQ